MIGEGEAERFEMRGAVAAHLDVGDGVFELPAQAVVQITDGHGRRAADAGGAMEIDDVALGDELIEGFDGGAKLRTKLELFLDHGGTAQDTVQVW